MAALTLPPAQRIVTPSVAPVVRAAPAKPGATKRPTQILQSGREPAQLSLFLRPAGAP